MSTLHQINQKAQQILRAELGPIDYVRYQQQFSQGNGDYTAERQVCASEDISIIAERVASLKSLRGTNLRDQQMIEPRFLETHFLIANCDITCKIFLP